LRAFIECGTCRAVKENNLQDPDNKRCILPDDKLRKLFDFPLNMFSINKQLSKHCKSAGKVQDGKSESKPAKKKRKSDKASEKGSDKKKLSGFALPQKLSAELQEVVGKDVASRGECQKLLWEYIKEHNLQNPDNKQQILVHKDVKLHKLLQVDECTGFGMSKHLKDHFLGAAESD
jgi:upstream activation factor subunit UAF30